MCNNGHQRNWSSHIDWRVACHRAGGRRAYNARRQLQALLRQRELVALLHQPGLGLTNRGAQAAIAR